MDATYDQADIQLDPATMQATSQMTSTDYFRTHNRTITAQFAGAHGRLGQLTAGQKKDLVVARQLLRNPGQVAIYGWHRHGGRAIQPLSTVHGASYADYSHGVRLVSTAVFVNGQARSFYDVLADPQLAPILNSEGNMPNLAQFIHNITHEPVRAPRIPSL